MWGRTREILKLYHAGKSNAEIARLLNCSAANVTLTLQRHNEWDHRVGAIPPASQAWMLERAKKLRVPPKEMAARLLVEIIDMYMTGDY